MNRTERVQDILRLEGLADAAKKLAARHREALADEARGELEREGTAPTWRLPDIGTVSLPVSKETVYVADEPALTAWVESHWPEEVERLTRVRPAFLTRLLTEAHIAGDTAYVGEGECVPGLAVRSGGLPQSLSIRPSRDARTVFAAAGVQWLESLLTLAQEVPGHLGPADVPDGPQ